RFLSSSAHGHHSVLPSFPTRRSSDLVPFQEHRPAQILGALIAPAGPGRRYQPTAYSIAARTPATCAALHCAGVARGRRSNTPWRSEEHTSELQSRENLVCRLLLEKKK